MKTLIPIIAIISFAFLPALVYPQSTREGRIMPTWSSGPVRPVPKTRGETKSVPIGVSVAGRKSPSFKGDRNGFDFQNATFSYQFANCGGEVQMGVTIKAQHQYDFNGRPQTRFVQIFGYTYKGQYHLIPYAADDVEILEVEADLYFDSVRLGKINIDNIVGNFAGCFGETYEVVKQVGQDPTKKEYLENLDKFELRQIRVLRGDVKISQIERQKLHNSFDYDEFGNPRNPKAGTDKPQTKQKYDLFGNPIKP